MSNAVDVKAHTLGKLYSDQDFAQSTMKEVEDIRKEANNMSIAATIAIFSINEMARLTLRSRKSFVSFLTFF